MKIVVCEPFPLFAQTMHSVMDSINIRVAQLPKTLNSFDIFPKKLWLDLGCIQNSTLILRGCTWNRFIRPTWLLIAKLNLGYFNHYCYGFDNQIQRPKLKNYSCSHTPLLWYNIVDDLYKISRNGIGFSGEI